MFPTNSELLFDSFVLNQSLLLATTICALGQYKIVCHSIDFDSMSAERKHVIDFIPKEKLKIIHFDYDILVTVASIQKNNPVYTARHEPRNVKPLLENTIQFDSNSDAKW